MRLSTGVKAVSLAMVLGGVTAIDLLPAANALPSEGVLVARARRLNFRTGVRSSRYRVGGFSRSGGTCGSGQQPMALVPPPQSQEKVPATEAAVDKTIAERPTFFVYLPLLATKTAQFELQNESGRQQLHSTEFPLPKKAGIVGIALPDSVPALQLGQRYLWQVTVTCDVDDPSSIVVLSGWIERVTSTRQITGNRVMALAEQGIWQDVVTQLAMQRYQRPNDLLVASDWAALMEDAGLAQFKRTEVVQIVKN